MECSGGFFGPSLDWHEAKNCEQSFVRKRHKRGIWKLTASNQSTRMISEPYISSNERATLLLSPLHQFPLFPSIILLAIFLVSFIWIFLLNSFILFTILFQWVHFWWPWIGLSVSKYLILVKRKQEIQYKRQKGTKFPLWAALWQIVESNTRDRRSLHILWFVKFG